MSSPSAAQHKLMPIYQCDSDVQRTLHSVREKLHHLCSHHSKKLVKVETMDGDVFEGYILHCDRGILYLCLSNEGHARGFFPGPLFPGPLFPNPYYNNVLPLVLFNLLAISLI